MHRTNVKEHEDMYASWTTTNAGGQPSLAGSDVLLDDKVRAELIAMSLWPGRLHPRAPPADSIKLHLPLAVAKRATFCA